MTGGYIHVNGIVKKKVAIICIALVLQCGFAHAMPWRASARWGGGGVAVLAALLVLLQQATIGDYKDDLAEIEEELALVPAASIMGLEARLKQIKIQAKLQKIKKLRNFLLGVVGAGVAACGGSFLVPEGERWLVHQPGAGVDLAAAEKKAQKAEKRIAGIYRVLEKGPRGPVDSAAISAFEHRANAEIIANKDTAHNAPGADNSTNGAAALFPKDFFAHVRIANNGNSGASALLLGLNPSTAYHEALVKSNQNFVAPAYQARRTEVAELRTQIARYIEHSLQTEGAARDAMVEKLQSRLQQYYRDCGNTSNNLDNFSDAKLMDAYRSCICPQLSFGLKKEGITSPAGSEFTLFEVEIAAHLFGRRICVWRLQGNSLVLDHVYGGTAAPERAAANAADAAGHPLQDSIHVLYDPSTHYWCSLKFLYPSA